MRLLLIRDALRHGGVAAHGEGLPSGVGAYLAPRYGFSPAALQVAEDRIIAILQMLDARLARHPYLMGETLTALDIYWATFANLLTPLSEEEMPMSAVMRKAYTATDARILETLSLRLRQHQRHVYDQHLELPVQL